MARNKRASKGSDRDWGWNTAKNKCKPEDRFVEAIPQIITAIKTVQPKYAGVFEIAKYFKGDDRSKAKLSVRGEFYALLVAEGHKYANVFTPKCGRSERVLENGKAVHDGPCGDCARCFFEACCEAAEKRGLIEVQISRVGRILYLAGEKPERVSGPREYKPTALTAMIRQQMSL